MKVASLPSAMFLFGRKHNASDATAPPSLPVTLSSIVAAACPPPPPQPAPEAEPAPVTTSAPATPSSFALPRGVNPASRRLQQRVHKLRRELRVTGRSLVRQRIPEVKPPLFVLASPLPELAPIPAPVPVEETLPLPAMPELQPEAAAPAAGPALDETALKALVAAAPAFVEMQYELVDLRHQLEALQTAAAAKPEPPAEPAAPALDETAVKSMVGTAPAFVEMQYELVDLRHQLQAMQTELAALKASASQAPAALTASQLAIVDANGQVVANVSSEGVVSCSSIVFMAQR